MEALRSRRHSEQQKIERELFPQCIQAPIKYFNKRKSLNIPIKKSDRKSILFPGEGTSVTNQEMDSSKKYVEQWLMQHVQENPTELRQPFSTLNANISRLKLKIGGSKKQSIKKSENDFKENVRNEDETRKRKYNVKKKSLFKSYNTNTALTSTEKVNILGCDPKKIKLNIDKNESYLPDLQKENNNFNKDIETIVIEETQDEVFDKDKLALKAVQEADNREKYLESEIKLHCSENIKYSDIENTISNKGLTVANSIHNIQRVPFFKKDIILENCRCCNEYMTKGIKDSQDVTITIESKDFTTTINLSGSFLYNPSLLEKHSVPIQTDICGIDYMKTNELSSAKQTSVLNSNCTSNALILKSNILTHQLKKNKQETCKSEDILVEEINDSEDNTKEKSVKNNKLLIIEESDSELENAERSSKHSELMFGVLTEMEGHVFKHRTKNKMRCRTPTSTDSSDKENRDPNRRKLQKCSKKNNRKKKT